MKVNELITALVKCDMNANVVFDNGTSINIKDITDVFSGDRNDTQYVILVAGHETKEKGIISVKHSIYEEGRTND